MEMPDLIATTKSLASHPEGTEVQVEVVGPKGTPNFTRSIRARARALVAAGAVPSIVDSVEDITMGQINRLTDEEGKPIHENRGRVTEATLHTIIVNRD